MYDDVIKACVSDAKRFTSAEDVGDAAKKAIDENPANEPFFSDVTRPMALVGSFAYARAYEMTGLEEFLAESIVPGGPSRIAVFTAKRWRPGRTIRVLFLDGDPRVQSKVKDYAQQWERYANIDFEFSSDSDAEIQISFERDPGKSWSWMGTDALKIASGEPTMNFGWLTPQSEEKEYSRVVLHEFGHALACIHEHQHPKADISWNKEALYRYYAQIGWSMEDVDQQVIAHYNMTQTNSGSYDKFSIMHYPIPASLVSDPNDVVGWNTELSPTDKQFIRTMYPF